ncbi:MAG: sigma-54 dependent transcriptional regulator [Proteobacteria bacterium]|nr:sigma-54 dependent transcriptional regulator [Pseudomonadota bacterium]MBU1714204.1 sigma-54 dependent transcriptional regulator [Pseudomonadota bacterium]
MANNKILVVDDDQNLLDLIQIRLEASGYEVAAANHESKAKEIAGQQQIDLAVIDLQLAKQDGLSLMEELHLSQPDLPVIILTAHGSIESAVDAMKRGAFTYLTKPFDSRELIIQIERAREKSQLTGEIKRLRELLEDKYNFANIVAKSQAMQRVLDQVTRIAGTESTVAISGPSGTGKELIAKAIHLASQRRDYPFLAINCAAIPENLLESELFGHEKGAFTGAVKKSKGLFTRAEKGTVFLDEIGDLPFAMQAKLLRVLQERIVLPLGGEQPVAIDVRVIVATNKDLKKEVANGNFREDLFYRIQVIPIELPPLRDRKEDIPPLVEHFIKKYGEQMAKKVKAITPAAMHKLMLHQWPGNVRELENTIEFAIAMTDSDTITDDLILKTDNDQNAILTLKEARDGFEKNYLRDLLKVTGGNVSKAAEFAGKYRADFYNLLKKYELSPGDFKD